MIPVWIALVVVASSVRALAPPMASPCTKSRQNKLQHLRPWKMPAEQEAVTIRRELAAANPDRHRPDLATSLRVLADSLDLLGHRDDASAARSEAAALTGGPAE
jgi:hypothetical protein